MECFWYNARDCQVKELCFLVDCGAPRRLGKEGSVRFDGQLMAGGDYSQATNVDLSEEHISDSSSDACKRSFSDVVSWSPSMARAKRWLLLPGLLLRAAASIPVVAARDECVCPDSFPQWITSLMYCLTTIAVVTIILIGNYFIAEVRARYLT